MRSRWLCWTLVSLFVVTPLTAQDTSHVSLVIGQRGPGVLVSVSDNAAIRADVTFSRASSGDFHSQTETVGLSGLLYLGRWDALRSYVGPRVSYSYSSSSGSNTAKQWSGQAFFGTERSCGRSHHVVRAHFRPLQLPHQRTRSPIAQGNIDSRSSL